jgi:hypothetical protein
MLRNNGVEWGGGGGAGIKFHTHVRLYILSFFFTLYKGGKGASKGKRRDTKVQGVEIPVCYME